MKKRFFRIIFLGLIPFHMWIILSSMYDLLMGANTNSSTIPYMIFACILIAVFFVIHFLVYNKWCIKHLFFEKCCGNN
ncbi:MAG: hypothetical protein HOF69_03310 [Campylobacteraceae bacterium]|jgi:hypothetical protein|nr:hypothetical protein [Campylobacteraceae bacterium]MBT6578297.1 hypothetical protein [Campylobacteraceae bacterium]MBT7117322.1 hypothetical protein [Campylobacteraceae bacterium]